MSKHRAEPSAQDTPGGPRPEPAHTGPGAPVPRWMRRRVASASLARVDLADIAQSAAVPMQVVKMLGHAAGRTRSGGDAT